MAASTITSFLLMRLGYRKPIIAGTIAIAAGLFLLASEWQGVSLLGINFSAFMILSAIMMLNGLGVGTAAPAANNACIELMPDKVATITGLRGMFRQSGHAIAITLSTLVLQTVGNMPHAFHLVFITLGIIMLLSLPAVFVMPSSPKC